MEKTDISDKTKLKEIEKNIYSSFDSFDKSIKKAGGILKIYP